MEDAIQYAKKYLEDMLSFFGLNTNVYATSEDDVIELEVPSTHLNGFLIGQRGENMRAMQFLVSNALKNQGFEYSRVNVDIADYKKQRADRLSKQAEDWMKQVKESGEPMHLEPMNAADRRTVHKLAQEYEITSESVGDGRDRHIVLKTSDSSEVVIDSQAEADFKEESDSDTSEKDA
ncbi:MAG: R3H domain-containing nucleic acid-binding protein [Candidatus Saccharimonadales bacterium]